MGFTCVSAKSNSVISTNNSCLDSENPVVEEHDGVPAIMLTFNSTASTPQQTDGTMGTITVNASGVGTVEYKLGLSGTWQTKGSFKGLTAGTYIVYAKDNVTPRGISTSVTVDYVVYIPDANFKAALLGNTSINTNFDDQIQVTEAEAWMGSIDVSVEGITDLTGIEAFTGIDELYCNSNALTELDLSSNTALEKLDCDGNNLTELDFSSHGALNYIDCHNNLLTSLNVRNGNNTDFLFFNAQNNDLTCITVDAVDYSTANWEWIDEGVAFSINCDDPPPVIDNVITTQINCHGNNDGSIEIAVSGGIGTISYSIDDGGTWQLANFFGQLPPDDYNVKVKDDNGYVASFDSNPVTISEPAYDPLNIDDITETQNSDKTWNYEITASGGVPPYLYRADDGAWQSSNVFENYVASTYTFYVQDDNGCEDSLVSYEILDIPDANFKAYLVGNATINSNGDTEIQINEAEAYNGLISAGGLGIADMTGIEYFVNITRLWCYNNPLLTELDVSNNVKLRNIDCWWTSLSEIDLSQNTLLEYFDCHISDITYLDLTNQALLESLNCSNNSLTGLDLRNGNNEIITSISGTNNAALTCVSVDDPAYAAANWADYFDEGVTFSANCDDPPVVISDVDITYNPGCSGDPIGTIAITATGGSGTILYSIDSGLTWQSSNTFTDLFADDYYVKAKDDNGYIASWGGNPVIITEPELLFFDDISVTWDDVSETGDITITVSGGMPPYEYKLDDGFWQSTNSYTSLAGGTYTVYIRDACPNIDSSDVFIGEPGGAFVNIPDANFKSCLVANEDINTNGDDEIQVSEAESYSGKLNVGSKGISDLTGIGAFVNLDTILCSFNDISSLDFSQNTSLVYINCYHNQLTSIDISNNTLLETINCSVNSLTSLDVSNNPALVALYASDNSLTVIDVSNNPLLTQLYCYNNSISSIDVTSNILLKQFDFSSNSLSSIDITNNTALIDFSCSLNDISSLDVSQNDSLQTLYCNNNLLTTLDVSNNPFLLQLVCSNNSISSLDVSNNDSLYYFNCGNNLLTSLDVSNLAKLTGLRCGGNSISSVDLSNNTILESLYVDSNLLTSLDVSNNPLLDFISCYDNALTSLDVSNNPLLETLWTYDNSLGSLDISGNPLITKFKCQNNSLVSLNMRNGNNLSLSSTNLNCENNPALTCVTVDDVTYATNNWSTCFDSGISFSTDCNVNPISIDLVEVTDVSGCYGGSNGVISVSASGGTGSLSYSIDEGDTYQSSGTFSSLSAGSYNIVVKDEAGDSVIWLSNPAVVSQPDSVIITAVDITADTGSSSGEIDITAEGGSNTFTYSIDGGSTFVSASTFAGLAAGEYTVVVQDSETCQADSVVTVPDVSIEISDVATTDVTGCYGDENGSITITASGGDGTLSYSIDDGETWQTSDEFTGLAAGSYNVRVKDGNEDEVAWAANPVVLVGPEEISFFVSSIDPNCAGQSSGLIRIINNTGGTGAFNFSIDGGVTWDTDSIFINLPAGSYNIVVRDANGCEKEFISNPRVLSDPDPLEIGNVQTTNNTHCSGDGNGTIQISLAEPETTLKSVNGLAPVYSYSIDDGDTWHEDTSLFENLSGGTYNVWAMNENQCTDEWDANPVVIEDVSTLEIDTFRVADDDGTGTGEIEVIVTGGTTPYEYRLDDGAWQTSQLFESLFAGTYLFQVSDSTGCEDSRSITVEEEATVPETETIAGTTFEDGDELCFGATLTITVGGEGSDSVDFESGSSTLLIAGGSVTFLPGTHIHSGSYLWAFITTDGSFCDVYAPSLVETVVMPVKGMKEQTVHEQQRAVAGVVDKQGGGYALKVFPNPNNGRFSIELSGFVKPAELVIYNSLGAVVKRLPVISGNTTPVQLTLKQGIYYVKALSKEKSLYQKIIIK